MWTRHQFKLLGELPPPPAPPSHQAWGYNLHLHHGHPPPHTHTQALGCLLLTWGPNSPLGISGAPLAGVGTILPVPGDPLV